MRFYNPTTNPPERVDSKELFPMVDEETAARRCVNMGLLPSVTNVLGVIRQEWLEKWKMGEAIKNFQKHGNQWKAIEEFFDRDSPESNFGTEVHEIVHQAVTGGTIGDSKAAKYALPAIEWLNKNMGELLGSEVTLACHTVGAGGTIDLAFKRKNGKRVLGDLKVVKIRKNYHHGPPLGYRCQLSAYSRMFYGDPVKEGWDEEAIPERLSLYLASPFGDDTVPRLMLFPYKQDYWDEFVACRTIWHAQFGKTYEEVGTTKKGSEGFEIKK
jgi:hypothetical protein